MSNSKGKERVEEPEDGEKNIPERSAEPSILSRVAASASGLTRSAFTSPNGNELSAQAAAALSNTGKGQSSSRTSDQGSWAESSKLSQPSSYPQASGSSGLRVGHSDSHVQQSEDEFSNFLDGIDSFTPSEGLRETEAAGVPNGFDQVWARSQNVQPLPNAKPAARLSVAEQERQDGQDVIALLSGPTALDEQFEAPEEDEYYNWGLSSGQIIELRAMTKDTLPPPEQHTGMAADNALNLVPMSDEYDKNEWVEQWDGVLNRYTDEVWGGLLPLVKEARKEVDDMKNGQATGKQPKALRRLNAILGHLQKR